MPKKKSLGKKSLAQRMEALLSDPSVLDAIVKAIPTQEVARQAVKDEVRRILLLTLAKRAFVETHETSRGRIVVMEIQPAERLMNWQRLNPEHLAPIPRAVTAFLKKAGAPLDVVRLDAHRTEDRYEMIIDPVTDRL